MLEVISHGAVRELRLARAPVNALNTELINALEAAIADAERESDERGELRALVISGGAKLFSAGLDVREVAGERQTAQALVLAFSQLQLRLARCSLPLIAAITGHSPAGGAVIAILCDHRVMARGAFRIGLNEVQVGLYPGEIIFRCYERLIGTARAASLLSRGVMLSADEALAAGLVDELVDPEQVVARAVALGQEIAQLPPQTYRRTRTMIRADLVRVFEHPTETLASLMQSGWVTDETRARMASLLR
jgi:3,2-trans-enoyl-CoA isomerase